MQLLVNLKMVRKAIAKRGLIAAISHAPKALYRRFFPPTLPPHPFDLEHGTDTGGVVYTRQLVSSHENVLHAVAYWGTHPSLFDAVLEAWQQTLEVPLQRHSFIDVGCGKGRVLLLASEFPFRSITGIDLSKPLVDAAQANINIWLQKERACGALRAVTADALTLSLPDEPVVIYLYNPFDECVMAPFLGRLKTLATARRDPIDLLYVNPLHFDLVASTPGITCLHEAEHSFLVEEYSVDALHDPKHRFAIFRLPGELHT